MNLELTIVILSTLLVASITCILVLFTKIMQLRVLLKYARSITDDSMPLTSESSIRMRRRFNATHDAIFSGSELGPRLDDLGGFA